jgi:H+/Cl- antiporter ClcA
MTATDPLAPVRTAKYVVLLGLAAIVGVVISMAAYWFLYVVDWSQRELFTSLPHHLGFDTAPTWWPAPLLVVGGVITAVSISFLPGTGGHRPAEGFHVAGVATPPELPGILLASLATLAFGAVLGPEAPLIALGGGLAAAGVRLARRDAPVQMVVVVGAAGSFAAISTLLGSPILGAFLLMEAAGFGGPTLGVVLVPGLLAAGIGSLIFIGLDSWTGLGTFSLAVPNLPAFGRPDGGEFAWALAIGVAAALLGFGIRRLGLFLQAQVERRVLVLTPLAGLAVAALAILFATTTDKNASDVLFSGQTGLGSLIANSASYSVGALVLLVACKSLAYGTSLSAFRGGPIFPAMFVGAAGGIALSHLPGLPLVAGVAMGIGAMAVAMLGLPLTSVLLATLLLASDGVAVMPLVIVAVAVSYVVSTWLSAPAATTAPASGGPDQAAAAPAADAAHAATPGVAPGSR